MSDNRVEQLFRFALGIVILVPLAIAFLADQLNGRTFTVDPFYATIVGAVITYFFTSGTRQQSSSIASETIKAVNASGGGNGSSNTPTVTSGPSSRGTTGGA